MSLVIHLKYLAPFLPLVLHNHASVVQIWKKLAKAKSEALEESFKKCFSEVIQFLPLAESKLNYTFKNGPKSAIN